MASQVAMAAGDEAEHTLQTARGSRFIDRLPGVRTGAGMYNHLSEVQQSGGGRVHNRQGSGSSGSSKQQRGGIGLGPAPNYASHLQNRGLGGNVHTGRKYMFSHRFLRFRNVTDNLQNLHLGARHDRVAFRSLVEPVRILY